MAMQSQKPYVAMVFVQCVYAGMALFSKAAMSNGMNPHVFVVYRQAFATLALAPFVFFFESGKSAPLSFSMLCKIFTVSLVGITLSLNLYYVSIKYTSASFAAATMNAIPAITFVMASLLRMESISVTRVHGVAKVVGSVASVGGALVFGFVRGGSILHWDSKSTVVRSKCSTNGCIKGPLMMISANIAWSFWLILQGVVVKQYPAKLRLTALQCCFSCIQSALCALAMERQSLSSWILRWDLQLLSVAYCGLIVTALSYWLQVWAIERKGPVFIALFTPLALIITATISAFLWKQPLYWGSFGGAILLVGGLYSVLWAKNKENRDEKPQENKQEDKEDII